MDIRIDNSSEVPIRHQLAEQIVFLIATNRLAAGEALPSVREMARRLKIHHNTRQRRLPGFSPAQLAGAAARQPACRGPPGDAAPARGRA